MDHYSIFLLTVFSVFFISGAQNNEPITLKLYDILDKMLNVEHKIEKWERERESFQETVLSILEHRKREMKEFRDEIINGTTHFSEILDTRVVAFNAYTTTSGNYGDNKEIIFPLVLLNKGEGYNKDTGRFTAPVSGLYYFSAHVCHQQASYMVISIVQIDKNIATTTEYEHTSSGSCSSVSAPAVLKTGEYVFIRSSYVDSKMYATSDHRWPSFTGVLVQVM